MKYEVLNNFIYNCIKDPCVCLYHMCVALNNISVNNITLKCSTFDIMSGKRIPGVLVNIWSLQVFYSNIYSNYCYIILAQSSPCLLIKNI